MRPKVADGDRKKRSPALQEPIFGVFGAPNFTNTQKLDKMVGDKFFSGPLTMLRRPVYAFDHGRCPKSGNINYCFLLLYSMRDTYLVSRARLVKTPWVVF